MRTNQVLRQIISVTALMAMICSFASSTATAGLRPSDRIAVAPINSSPYGKSYSEWATEWWQWAYSIPSDPANKGAPNPLFDTTGANCNESQSGRVFFLAGRYTLSGSTDPLNAERTCEVPSGKAIFFPIVNSESDNLNAEDGSFGTKSKATLKAEVKAQVDSVDDLSVIVDGVSLRDPFGFRVKQKTFSYSLPSPNVVNALGYEAVGATDVPLAVSDGYYLMLYPLSPGDHTVRFSGGISGVFHLDIIYHLTVGCQRHCHHG